MRRRCSTWSVLATCIQRISNPTNAVLEQRVSALEGGIGAISHRQRAGRAAPVRLPRLMGGR